MKKSEVIAAVNDQLRRSLPFVPKSVGKFTLTPGVAYHRALDEIILKVRAFNQFSEDNDPYGEHDFGAIEVDGGKFFWKIDYYDSDYEFGVEDPTSSICRRVLTIMRTDEY